MTTLVPSANGYASVDDFPPLTNDQVARVSLLLSVVRPQSRAVTA